MIILYMIQLILTFKINIELLEINRLLQNIKLTIKLFMSKAEKTK